MISQVRKGLSFFLLFALWLLGVQGLGAQEINYKLGPNLQQNQKKK